MSFSHKRNMNEGFDIEDMGNVIDDRVKKSSVGKHSKIYNTIYKYIHDYKKDGRDYYAFARSILPEDRVELVKLCK